MIRFYKQSSYDFLIKTQDLTEEELRAELSQYPRYAKNLDLVVSALVAGYIAYTPNWDYCAEEN